MPPPSNQEKKALWQAYRDRKPTRVPITYGVNPRIVLFDPKWNPRGITFQEYHRDPDATIEVQLAFMEFQSQYLNQYCDNPLGRPEKWAFHVDNQNTYDSAYFGAPLEFRDGQVADVSPYLAGAGKEEIFRKVDLDHPLDNPFIKNCLARYEALKTAAAKLSYHGMTFSVNPPLLGFDGHLTIAANLRAGEIFSDLYEDPGYAGRLFDFLHRGVVKRNRALAELFGRKAFEGPSGSFADDSIALISCATYRERILTWHRAWYDLFGGSTGGSPVAPKNTGPTPAPPAHSIHLCGDATRHFPIIHEELNVCSFDTGFPVDHGRLRRELGEDVEILGGPEVGLLLNGTPEQVYGRTRSILASGIMRGGRFVLREGNNLPPCVPEANLSAMYRCASEHGRYR